MVAVDRTGHVGAASPATIDLLGLAMVREWLEAGLEAIATYRECDRSRLMRVFRLGQTAAAGLALAIATSPIATAQSLDLPATVPAPEVHAAPAGNVLPKRVGDTPIPEARPVAEPPDATRPVTGDTDLETAKAGRPAGRDPAPAETPDTGPIPEGSPLEDHGGRPQDAGPAGAKPDEPAPPLDPPPDPRSGETRLTLMPPAEIACRQRLRDLGVSFEERRPESDPAGCSMPYPISVGSLGGTVALEPPAAMNCAMAEATARFTAGTIAPFARRDLGADLESLSQASAYVCRPRNGTRKLSEHAFGNALDIARFNLSDGRSVDVDLQPDPAAAAFFAAVRKAACGPFKTVLGPGSDADHATHFHLDLAPRRNGATFCQ